MASLNDAAGDGCFISLDVKALTEVCLKEELFNMTSEQVKHAEQNGMSEGRS